jgi:carbon storage regulator CsrA
MLILARRIGEKIVLPDCEVTITVLCVTAKKVKLVVTAPASLPVHRREVLRRAGRTGGRTCERAPVGGMLDSADGGVLRDSAVLLDRDA